MISVIIPCYNAEKYVYDSVVSILNQNIHDIEVIVVDDASTDNSLQEIKRISDSRLILFSNDKNKGYLRTINSLLLHTKGEYIAFQDADDLSHPDRLKLQFEYLIANPEISIVGTNYAVISEKGKIIRSHSAEENSEVLAKQLESGNPFQKPSIMFRREVFLKIGGFREEFLTLKNISEDYDWLLRASHHFQFGNINGEDSLYFYRMVTTAMTKDFRNINQLFGHKVAQFLHSQRISNGHDCIESGDLHIVHSYIDDLSKPYLDDPIKFYEEKTSYLLFGSLYSSAIRCSFKAFWKSPSFRAFRLVQFCIRKAVYHVFAKNN